jgi:SAM-dependent methyltransferase
VSRILVTRKHSPSLKAAKTPDRNPAIALACVQVPNSLYRGQGKRIIRSARSSNWKFRLEGGRAFPRSSHLFASLHPQLPYLTHGAKRALDLGCGNHPISLETSLADQWFGADLYPVKSALPTVACEGTRLPFAEDSFDLIVSRLAIPYMRIPHALREIRRVLTRGGCLWTTLHLPRMAVRRISRSIKSRDAVDIVYQLYAILNGLLLSRGPYQLPWYNGRFESVQTPHSIRLQLEGAGFERVQTELCPDERGRVHFAALAFKP